MSWIKALLLPFALVALWQISANASAVQSDTLASPSQIIAALWTALGTPDFWDALQETLIAGAFGLTVGGGLGILVGILFGLIPPVSKIMRIPVEFLRPLPSIAILPILLLLLGFGYALEVTIVAFNCFFVMLILTEIAVRQIEPRLSEVSRALRLSRFQHVTKIVIPAVMPRVFVALRLAAGVALIVAITVEVAANPMGLGARLMKAAMTLRPADMFATLFVIGLIGWLVNTLLVRSESLLFRHNREASK